MKKIFLFFIIFFGLYNYSLASFSDYNSGSESFSDVFSGIISSGTSSYNGSINFSTGKTIYLKNANCFFSGSSSFIMNIGNYNSDSSLFYYDRVINNGSIISDIDYDIDKVLSGSLLTINFIKNPLYNSVSINFLCVVNGIYYNSFNSGLYGDNLDLTSTGYLVLGFQDNYGNYHINFESFKIIVFFVFITLLGLLFFALVFKKVFESGYGKKTF